jgi:shikimate dehydrogenase
MHFALLGYPLAHSFSKAYFEAKFAKMRTPHTYNTYPCADIQDFYAAEMRCEQGEKPHLHGFNVTIPHKTAIIPFLDRLDATAAAVGAVNTVVRVGEEWVGYNTDVLGFAQTLLSCLKKCKTANEGLFLHYQHFYILGNGGASKAVQHVLAQRGYPFTIISRQANAKNDTDTVQNYTFLNKILQQRSKSDDAPRFFIINATPVGTSPQILEKPALRYANLLANDVLLDLVYNPEQTAFLREGEARGCITQNGLEMLHAQADAAWQIWQRF